MQASLPTAIRRLGPDIDRLGSASLERPIETLQPGDPFRIDVLAGRWVYGHFIFANASRARVMLYDQRSTHVSIKGHEFTTSGDEEQNVPLGMMVESLADRHSPVTHPNPSKAGARGQSTEAEGGFIMTDQVKAAGMVAKYNHQHKQLNKALEMGDAGKAEQAQGRITALEAEAAAAGIELPVWDEPSPTSKTPNIDAAGRKGEQMAKEAAKKKAASAKVNGLDKKAAATKKKAEPRVKKLKKTHDCLCGCGAETLSLYAPGHDARVKGLLIKVERGDMSKDEVPETVAPFVRWSGKWKTDGFKLVACPVKIPGRPEIENTTEKALAALDV